MELPAPFKGWRYDEERDLIHTAAGYRCTPEQIEAALWLTGILRHEAAGKRLMYADTPLIEPRPRIYHWTDFDRRTHISVDHDSMETEPCTKSPADPNRLTLRRPPR
jgi:hypothetical protein